MAIGERIKYLRNLRGMTQKWLGMAIGFDEKNADVRMAQYESGTRTPKEKLISDLANALDVSTRALTVPDIDNNIGLMHTLFALEDLYGFKINSIDGELCLTLDKSKGNTYLSMFKMLSAWQQEAEKLKTTKLPRRNMTLGAILTRKWRQSVPKRRLMLSGQKKTLIPPIDQCS